MVSVLPTAVPAMQRDARRFAVPDIDDDAWRRALTAAQVMTIPAGAIAIRPGDPCRNLLLIESGGVRVCQRAADGRMITLLRANAGEICVYTLQALMEDRDYDVEIAGEDETRVVCVPQSEFHRCLAESDAFRRFVIRLMGQRLCELSQLVHQVAFVELDQRLACLLGRLFGQRKTARLQVTHQELANELGSSRETISRLLKEFEQKGCLRLRRGSIELAAPDGLARLSSGGGTPKREYRDDGLRTQSSSVRGLWVALPWLVIAALAWPEGSSATPDADLDPWLDAQAVVDDQRQRK